MNDTHRAEPDAGLPADASVLRQQLRGELRQRRAALSPRIQARASAMLHRTVMALPLFHRARRIAFYLPARGEIDPRPLLYSALRSGRQCYLPVLSPLHRGKMYFVRVEEDSPLRINRWGIAEPVLSLTRIINARALDLVLMPLVGFDRNGNRLGMGKGFYDRHFAFRQGLRGGDMPPLHRPVLAGLAHDCQEVRHIPSHGGDVPLDHVICPAECITPPRV